VLGAIAEGLSVHTEHHSITKPDERVKIPEFTKDDLVIVGMPVYSGRIPALAESFLKALKAEGTPAVLVAVYGNRDIDDALVEMQDILNEGGFVPLAGAAFIGEHSLTAEVAGGRPDAADLKTARLFGQTLKEKCAQSSLDALKFEVRGNRPYRERKAAPPLGPTIGDGCTVCGTCVAACPSGALSVENGIRVDEGACILCHSCAKGCPENAITFGGRVQKIRDFLIENCSDRKEPELFYPEC
jgi:ferredoxin